MTNLEKYEQLKEILKKEEELYHFQDYECAAVQVRLFFETVLQMYSKKVDFSGCSMAFEKLARLKELMPSTFISAMYLLKDIGNSGAHADKDSLDSYVKNHVDCEKALSLVIIQVETDFFIFFDEARNELKKVLSNYNLLGMQIERQNRLLEGYSQEGNCVTVYSTGYYSSGIFSKEDPFLISTKYDFENKEIVTVKIVFHSKNLFTFHDSNVSGLWLDDTHAKNAFFELVRSENPFATLSNQYYLTKLMDKNSPLKGLYLSMDIYKDEHISFMFADHHWNFEGQKIIANNDLNLKEKRRKDTESELESRKYALHTHSHALDVCTSCFLAICGKDRNRIYPKIMFCKELNDYILTSTLSDIKTNVQLLIGMSLTEEGFKFHFLDSNLHVFYSCLPIRNHLYKSYYYNRNTLKYEKRYIIPDFFNVCVSLMNQGVLLPEIALKNSKNTAMLSRKIKELGLPYENICRKKLTKRLKVLIPVGIIVSLILFITISNLVKIQMQNKRNEAARIAYLEQKAQEDLVIDTYVTSFEEVAPYTSVFFDEADSYFNENDISQYLDLPKYKKYQEESAVYEYSMVGYYMVFADCYEFGMPNNIFGIVYEKNVVTSEETYGPILDTYEFNNIRFEDGKLLYDTIGSCKHDKYSGQGPNTHVYLDFTYDLHGHSRITDYFGHDDEFNTSVYYTHIYHHKLNDLYETHYWVSEELQEIIDSSSR